MCLISYQITSRIQVNEVYNSCVESLKVDYLCINIEDKDSVQIKMSFPLVYHFIDRAFEETKDFFKSPARFNPLVDDVYQSQIEMNKRHKLRLRSPAQLDTFEADFAIGESNPTEDIKEEI